MTLILFYLVFIVLNIFPEDLGQKEVKSGAKSGISS